MIKISVTIDDEEVASIEYLRDHETVGSGGFISDVSVSENLRRRGIATAMWKIVQAIEPDALHSDTRTPEGEAWARSTGDDLPDLYDPTAGDPVWSELTKTWSA